MNEAFVASHTCAVGTFFLIARNEAICAQLFGKVFVVHRLLRRPRNDA